MAKFVTGAAKRLDQGLLQNLTPSFTEIPVIDISASLSPNLADRIALAKDIRRVCETVGFFYISNHGIIDVNDVNEGVDQSVVDGVFSEAKKFFDEPTEVKMEIDIDKNPNRRGYIPLFHGAAGENGRKGRTLQE